MHHSCIQLYAKLNKLSIRLSLIVVSSMAILLFASLIVMMVYARKALKEEALNNAAMTLEDAIQRIDNILLSVEQTAGNFYFRIIPQLNNKEGIITLSRQVVEANPHIIGCAIAFKPGYHQDGETFMAYHYRTSDSVTVMSETFGDTPYTEHTWFTEPMKTGRAGWIKPLSNMSMPHHIDSKEAFAVTTFSLPIYSRKGKPVGVIGIDVSLSLLSRIVMQAKPSANSYCTLLDRDGSFIVHPNSDKLFYENVYTQLANGADPSVEAAAKAMINGETGYKQFNLYGKDYYVFFKPFKRASIPGRATGDDRWSAGVIYPEEDIFGDYNSLIYYVLAIAIGGLLLLFLLCRLIIHHQLLPLQMLTNSAQRIANGHYDETIPESSHNDEIGRLQNNFQHMQQSLSAYIGELEQLLATLKERGDRLRIAYDHAQKADRMKTAFLHNMTTR